ncbi:MAG: hypothetical protein CFH25_00013 [Alphaproteobacteria bacterium MarineAlpha6_Bin3]|nr:MAG: hypothetical protein CFH25_00013 [Alphaproteobacteria bacterium MarineAlpha6_Bin3]|tara:strand:- start:8845 stop:9138 length:294 start_codon:yes stop_codon:yes gene_type:complete
MKVKIYKPLKTATQSGLSKFKYWIVEFPKENNLGKEPLMGWHKSDNTHKQIQLRFNSLDQALLYVEKNKLDYILINEKEKKYKIKSYSDNFKHNRLK